MGFLCHKGLGLEFDLSSLGISKLVLAVSGGVDSMVLLDVLKAVDLPLRVLHFNFGLRGVDSDSDERLVVHTAKKLGLDFTVEKASKPPETGIQSWARDLRQSHYARWQAKGYTVATAHHQDDIAETVLFRIARGTSIGHLCNMVVYDSGIFRPLLSCSKNDIYAYAKSTSIQFREDGSNDTLKYSRNYIRHKILRPLENLYPGAQLKTALMAEEGREISIFLKNQLLKDLGYEGFPSSFLISLPKAVFFMAIELLIERLGAGRPQLSRSILDDIYRRWGETGKKKDWSLDLPHGMKVTSSREYLNIL